MEQFWKKIFFFFNSLSAGVFSVLFFVVLLIYWTFDLKLQSCVFYRRFQALTPKCQNKFHNFNCVCVLRIGNPLSARNWLCQRGKWPFPSALLAFRLCRPLSLSSLKLWFRFRIFCVVFMVNITHLALKGLKVKSKKHLFWNWKLCCFHISHYVVVVLFTNLFVFFYFCWLHHKL